MPTVHRHAPSSNCRPWFTPSCDTYFSQTNADTIAGMLGKAGLLAALGVVCIVSGGCKDDDKAKRKAKERALASLPYMNSYPVTEPKTATMNGVTVNKGASVQDGLNLFGHCGGASRRGSHLLDRRSLRSTRVGAGSGGSARAPCWW